MDLSLTFEQQMLVDAARKMVETQIQPILDAHSPDDALPKSAVLAIMERAAELGLTSARIPADGGGAGLSMLDYGLMAEQIPPVVGLILQPHEATTARIHLGGTPEQRERLVPDLMAGRKIAATASSEPNVGSDPRGVETRAQAEGDDIIINGRKLWISNATICDVMNVTCRLTAPDGSSRLARVLVEPADSPFEATELHMLGLRQSPHGEVVFENCRVPIRNFCPDTGDTAKLLTLTWLTNRPLVGLMAVGLAQKALDLAVEYAKTRKQFGRPIGSFQLIQNDLAEIQTAIVTSRLVCYNALAAIDRGERANGLSAMAKRYAVDASDRAVALAMRVHGAMGLSVELGLDRIARDIRMLHIPDGTPGILTLIQGRELTGLDPFRG